MFISPWEGGLAHLAKIPVALAEILASGPASASTLYKHNKNFKRVQGMSRGSLLLCLYEQAGWPTCRGIEWFLEKSGSWKIFARPQNLGNVCDRF